MSTPLPPEIEHAREHLRWLQRHATAMLDELAGAAGLDAAALRADPLGVLEAFDAFAARTDFWQASGDARIWLVNRVALLLAEIAMRRHGGRLLVNDNRASRFYGRIVVGALPAPIPAGTSIDTFAAAREIVLATDGGDLRGAVARIDREIADATSAQAQRT